MGEPTKIRPDLSGWWQQLSRRKVVRVTSFYAVVAWGLVIGSAELLPTFGFTDSHMRALVIIAVALVPIVALLAWVYELTPHGIRRDPQDTGIDHTMTDTVLSSTYLVVKWEGKVARYTENVSIGRDLLCTIHLDDPQVSRRHASISLEGGRWVLRDLDSRNGTLVNGHLVTETVLSRESTVQLHAGGSPLFITVGGQGTDKSNALTSIAAVDRMKT